MSTPLLAPTLAITFTVYGTPRPQGSTRAFIPKGWNRAVITTDNTRLKPWRQQIAGEAVSLNLAPFKRDIPLVMDLDFYFEKPPSAKHRKGMTVRPDKDKLERSVFDALKGILYANDAQIVDGRTRKLYGLPERVEIRIQEAL